MHSTESRILVVDDDPTVAEVVTGYLERAGHAVDLAADGPAALRAATQHRPDLVVLDLMLPGMDGLEVCRRLRATAPVPVIMLTARGDEDDRILGLEIGADDYVTKPFSPRELVLRVESVLRRARTAPARPGPRISRSGIALDPAARTASKDGHELALTLREFDLLAYLLARPGEAISRERLMHEVWGWEFGDLSTVTVHVRRLRGKIETDPAKPVLIRTVWGVGYRFEAEAEGEAEGVVLRVVGAWHMVRSRHMVLSHMGASHMGTGHMWTGHTAPGHMRPGQMGPGRATAGRAAPGRTRQYGRGATMGDVLLIALYAFLGAAAAGLGGALALRLLRHRSLTASVAVVAAVAVIAMLAGTLAVAWAMLLNSHDLTVVTVVVAMAAVASLATALLLGRRVVASSHRLALAARSFGDGGSFDAPTGPATAELAALSRELAATSAKLTESRERERALETSRRELVAWISHDLRTPLAGLRAMAEALEDGMAKDPDRYFRQIRTEVERLNSMVGDLFELSRIHAGALSLNPARMSVHDLIGDALAGADPLAREHGVRLVGERVDAVPVEVDGKEMTRVLANLLVNAIRHTPADGTVAVAAEDRDGAVTLSVTDGCGGIPDDDLPRVFDTGWRGTAARTPPGGAGLGLAIVRGIVEAHSGRAEVRNVAGGCRFELTLPVAPA